MTDTYLSIGRYSTERFAAGERLDAWLHRHWPSFASAVVAKPRNDFSAQTEEIGLGAATLFYGRFSENSIYRTPRLTRSDGLDHLGVCINLDGVMQAEQHVVRQGDVLLTDLSIPFEHHASACRTITIALPRAMVREAGIDPGVFHQHILGSAHGAMLRSHLLQLRRSAPQIAATEGPRLLRTIVDLLAVSLGDGGRPVSVAEGAVDVGRRLKARDLIEANIGRSTLTVAFLCRQLQVSRSTLYRLFEADGGVQDYIRKRRLELVRATLLDPDTREPIRDIAERLGFGDPAYLSRVFRQEFGLSPSDFRMIETGYSR